MHWLDDIVNSAQDTASARRALLGLYETSYRAGSWAWDVESGAMAWSPNLYRILGYERGVVTPSVERWVARVHEDDREGLQTFFGTTATAQDSRAEEHRGELELHYRATGGDGRTHLLRTTVAAEVSPGGRHILVGLTGDVTQMLSTEREIAAHVEVTESLGGWSDRRSGVRRLLQGLARAFNLDRAALWIPRDGRLAVEQGWSEAHGDGFIDTLGTRALGPGECLAGIAWEQRRAVGLESGPSVLAAAAPGANLRGALAIPALSGDTVVAVISIAGPEPVALTERLEATLAGIGSQIGAFLAGAGLGTRSGRLSQREVEVLQLAADGHAGADIARLLSVSPATVKSHFENIYAKYGTRDRVQTVAKALREGLIR